MSTVLVDLPRRRFSNSELQSFKDCRRRWYWSWHLGLARRVEDQVGPLRLGSRVHEALAGHYAGGNAAELHARYVERDRALVEAQLGHASDPEAVVRKFDSEAELGQIMVEGYLDWLAETGADAHLEVIAPEVEVEVPLETDGEVPGTAGRPLSLVGKLDLRVRRLTDGARLFVDHKTAQSFWDVYAWLPLNEQFLMYQALELAHARSEGDEVEPATGSLVGVLRKVKRTTRAKPPFYDRREVHHNRQEVVAFWRRLVSEVADVLEVEARLAEGDDHRQVCYPRPTRDCAWKCEFLEACAMAEDGSAVDAYLAQQFVARDPLERYSGDSDPEEERHP